MNCLLLFLHNKNGSHQVTASLILRSRIYYNLKTTIMKRIKLGFAALALALTMLSSFKSNQVTLKKNSSSMLFNRWFAYDGYGDQYDPCSYYLLPFGPDCAPAESYLLCAVYVESNTMGDAPSYLGLNLLGLFSESFKV
jgi:hypothetical protein